MPNSRYAMQGFTQTKLTREEWDLIEERVDDGEAKMLKFIENSYTNTNLSEPACLTILGLTKLSTSDSVHAYIYEKYLHDHIGKAIELFSPKATMPSIHIEKVSSSKLKSKDKIRVENTKALIKSNKNEIIEFVLINLLRRIGKRFRKSDTTWMLGLYTLMSLIDDNCYYCNTILKVKLTEICAVLEHEANITTILQGASNLIEENNLLLKYSDLRLYKHQREIFEVFNTDYDSKLVFYVAPTGTGKTITPIGLLNDYRIIFVCAARHVGLALARAALTRARGVGFAFGCEDEDDIKLHYGAAVEYDTDIRSGSIRRVDNSKGEKVEIMVTDLKSYNCAMKYMLRFNQAQKMIMYWDEPTISMDYTNHECHPLIKSVWHSNVIPNIVLSSATLPSPEELLPTSKNYKDRFDGSVHHLASHDCRKTITLLDRDGNIIMPHTFSPDLEIVQRIAQTFKKDSTLQRYLDLSLLNESIMEMTKLLSVDPAEAFPKLVDINMQKLKAYYLDLLLKLNCGTWAQLTKGKSSHRRPNTGVYLCSKDAQSLTGGPTIYFAKDIDKIGEFLIQSSKINDSILRSLEETLAYNAKVSGKHRQLQMRLEDAQAEDVGAKRTNKLCSDHRDSDIVKSLRQKIAALEKAYKKLELPAKFVPNSPAHRLHYQATRDPSLAEEEISTPFTTTINSQDVNAILLKDDISNKRKLLLMMGIGVLDKDQTSTYSTLMKKFASTQKLFLVVADTDYIYGTNYQFFHGFMGKDVGQITRSKIVQAMGRVGRNTVQQDFTFRFRSQDHVAILFGEDVDSVESSNFAKLLS